MTPLIIMRKQCPRFIRVARVCYDIRAFEVVKTATEYWPAVRAEDAIEAVAVFDVEKVGVAS